MQKNIESLRKEVAKQKDTIDKLKKQNHSIMQSFDDTELELTNKIKEISKLKAENDELKKKREENQSNIDTISEIPSLKAKISQLETNLEIAKDNIQSKSSLISEKDSLIASLKSEIEEHEETNTSLSDSLTKSKVEIGELHQKLNHLQSEHTSTLESLKSSSTRIHHLEEENQKLRQTINSLSEVESRLTTEVNQYKLNLERIKREKSKEESSQKDQLIEQANKLLEEFDAEKHLFKAKIKKLLIEYCNLNEDSYHIGDEVDMDEYLDILEKELKVFTDRVKEESYDRISKIMVDLESAQQQQSSLGSEIERLQKENEELVANNDQLVLDNQQWEEKAQNFEDKLEEYESKIEALKEKNGVDLEGVRKRMHELESVNKSLEGDLRNLQKANEGMEKRRAELERESEEIRETNKKLMGRNGELEVRNRELEGKNEKIGSLNKMLEKEKLGLDERVTLLENEKEELKNDKEQLEIKIAETESEKRELEEKIRKLQKEIQSLSLKEEKPKLVEKETEEVAKLKAEIKSLKDQLEEKEDKITQLMVDIEDLQDEKIEREQREEMTKAEDPMGSAKMIESSSENEDHKEFFTKIDTIERKVDQLKKDAGEIRVKCMDELREEYEKKYKELLQKVDREMMISNIQKKGKIKVLKELKDTMNDSIRILKCVNYDSKLWYLIEENDEFLSESDLQQYWIQDADLTAEEKEFVHEYLPQSMLEDPDPVLNSKISTYKIQIASLECARQELLKECREIRLGLKIAYFCMDEEFDEEVEQKLYQYDIQIIEDEDEIKNLSENINQQKLEINALKLKNLQLSKRLEEMNVLLRERNDTIGGEEQLVEKTMKLEQELERKNEEIESLKNSSIVGKADFLSQREDHSSREVEQDRDASYKEFDARDYEPNELSQPRSGEIRSENDTLRRKLKEMEAEMMDIQNRNNLIMTQNHKLKEEVHELEAKVMSRTSLNFEDETGKTSVKDIEHLKDILMKFLKEVPLTNKSNEQLLHIVFSMLYINKPQMDEIHQARKIHTANYEEDIVQKNKKPMFGGLFSRSKSRKR